MTQPAPAARAQPQTGAVLTTAEQGSALQPYAWPVLPRAFWSLLGARPAQQLGRQQTQEERADPFLLYEQA